MSIGSADGVIEVILKINDNTGKIKETAIDNPTKPCRF